MRELRFRVVALGVATELMRCGAALACGPSPIPYYVVAERAPSSEGTPLNAPLVVELEEDASGPVVDTFNPSLTLTKVSAEVAIELKSLGGRPTLAWVPVAPLEAETAYEAHFNPGYEGIPDTIWTFTTGTSSTPPLSLEGELEVTLEPGADTILDCASGPQLGCGSVAECTNRVVPVTKARVKIPRVIDGFPRRFGTLRLTDDTPFDFSPASKTPSPDERRKSRRHRTRAAQAPCPTRTMVSLQSNRRLARARAVVSAPRNRTVAFGSPPWDCSRSFVGGAGR